MPTSTITLHQQTWGTGKPVVLLHGWAMHSGIWRHFARQLARSYRVTCIDLPGHGNSPPLMPFTLANIRAALANTVSPEPACWLGWSLGATVALDFASHYPERANALVMLCGNPCFTQQDHWPALDAQVLEQFAGQLQINSQATLLRFLTLQVLGLAHYKTLLAELKAAVLACPAPDAATLEGGLAILKQTDLRATLAQLTIPTAAILGGHDTLVPIAVGDALQKLQPAMQIHRIAKAGHTPFLSHPETVLAQTSAFLNQLPA